MDVRKKVLLGIAGTLSLFILILFFGARSIIIGKFDRLESESMRVDVDRGMRALQKEIESLDKTVNDWAAWDDTYAFIEDHNEAYVSANINDETFRKLQINFLLYLNASGDLALGQAWDSTADKEVPIFETLQREISKGSRLLEHPDPKRGVKGVLSLPEGCFIVASRPILTSEAKGPGRGALIMGRRLDKAQAQKLAEDTQFKLEFFSPVDARSDIQKTLSKGNPILIQTSGERSIEGYGLIHDIHEKPSLIVKIEAERPIHRQGEETLFLLLAAMAITSCALFGVVWLMMGRLLFVPLKRAIRGLQESVIRTTEQAGQLSDSSGQLAEGASEQAAALEQTTSSLEEMASMTNQNAGNATQANSLMRDAAQVVERAKESMAQLTTSMSDISSASEETQKIVKTIDEISFQTNLLALNAAVEAARAGEAGAGFAVVADEVRSLALRAAEAAKNTASLIEGTVKKVKGGSDLVVKTDHEFRQVATAVIKAGELVGDISAASQEQAQGIGLLNRAVADMDKVTRQNAANAEESASASEEMSAQAEQMKEYVEGLTTLVGGNGDGKKKFLRMGGETRLLVKVPTSPSGRMAPASAHGNEKGATLTLG